MQHLLLVLLFLYPVFLVNAREITSYENTNTTILIVKVTGIEEEYIEKNIHAHLEIYRFNKLQVPEEKELRRLHNNAERNIRDALKPFGYYEPVISSTLLRDTDSWRATYYVEIGPAIKIKKLVVNILGEENTQLDSVFQKLRNSNLLSEGMILNQIDYEKFKHNLEIIAIEHGYFNARFTQHSININLQQHTADILIQFETGKRYKFGIISIEQDVISRNILSRYPKFLAGDYYDNNKLIELQRDLEISNYFSQVKINPMPNSNNFTIPVVIDLTTNKKYKFSTGIGYGTNTGPRGKFKVENRWLNTNGHHYNAELQLSPISSTIAGRYIIPSKIHPANEEYNLAASYSNKTYGSQYSMSHTINMSSSYCTRGKYPSKSYILNLQYERDQIENDIPSTISLLVMPELKWNWIQTDDQIFTKNGFAIGIEVKGTSRLLLSEMDFIQCLLHLKWIKTLHQVDRIIIRSEVGTTTIRDFEKLPLSLRFFTSSEPRLRGFSRKMLDYPHNSGSPNLLMVSFEYEHQLWKDWGIAFFLDTSTNSSNFTPELIHTGGGFGIRWYSPVGPLRLDIATSLEHQDDKSLYFSFSIGPDL